MIFKLLKWLAAGVLTIGLCLACWWLWTETPSYARLADRNYLNRLGLGDFSYLFSLIVIFLVLSLLHPFIQKVWAILFGQSDSGP